MYLPNNTANKITHRATKGEVIYGYQELELLLDCMRANDPLFNEQFSAEQLLLIYRMYLASGEKYLAGEWSDRQVKNALSGVVPKWDTEGNPVY
jgi:hypothetical protein